MVLRMKNFVLGGSHFNVLGVHWKIRLVEGGGGSRKADIVGGYPKKRGLDSLPIKEGGSWQERGECCFWGGVDTPVHTMILLIETFVESWV